MWATGMCSLVAASAAARVELTSPATSDEVGGVLQQDRLEPVSTAAVCWAWLPEPTPRLCVGLAHPELLDESAGEGLVVVLAGVEEAERDPLGLIQGGDHRSRLDEVRPRPHHREYRGSHSGAT